MKNFTTKNEQSTNRLTKILFGDTNTLSLDKKVFIASSFTTFIAAIVGLLWNIYMKFPIILNSVLGICIIVYFLLFYYSRYKNRYSPLIFVSVSILFLSILYLMNGGLNGSVPPIYVVFVAVSISISNSKYHILILMVTLINLLVLFIGENFFLKEFIIHYSNIEAKEMDISFGYIATLILCYFLISFYKRTITSKNKDLYKINANKDLFFNIIAHDLRAPLSNVLGFTNIMTDKTESHSLDKFQKYSEIANKESIKAIELLESLLEWGKIQMNKVQINPQTVSLYQIIFKIVDVFKNKCDEKEIEIGIQIPGEIYVFTDLDVLKIIIRNLVSNAIKFTPHGGTIVISAEDFNLNYITIIVKDNGIGMNSELIENLFHLHINTNRKGTDGEASNGLGLIITKELIEKQGGKLIIESHNKQGSTFKFTVLKSNKNAN